MKKSNNSLNIGVDIGGTKIAVGLVTPEGKILEQTSFPTYVDKGSDWIIEHLSKEIQHLVTNASVPLHDIDSIGIGVPGTVDLATGNVILAPNIYWRDVPLSEKMKMYFPEIAMYIDQDTNTAVLGEYFVCEDDSIENLFFMTISTGVGSGLILDKKLYRGRSNMAGEIGHTIVEKDGIPCTCGSKGCLQAYAKGPAIADIVSQRIKKGERSCLEEYAKDGTLTAIQVAEAAVKDDQLAKGVFLKAAEYIGIALANIVSLLNPDLIIIGGGVTQSGNLFIDKIRETAQTHCYPPARGSFRIALTTNSERSAIIGAAALHKTLGK